jgi:putative flippase GtrA
MQLTAEFIRFCVVGVLNTAIDFGLFALLTRLVGLDPLIANVLSFTTGAANSFLLNKYWTFGAGGRGQEMAIQATKFATISVLVWSIHEGLLFLLHKQLAWSDLLVKVLAIGVGVIVGFVGNKFWTFGKAQGS